MEKYWFDIDPSLVAYNDDNISLVIKVAGVAVDITGWSNMTYKASAPWTTDTIEVADAAMSQTSSGSGVTDTIVIPISKTDSAIDAGLYNHEFSCEIATNDRTIFRGTIRILERIAEVP